MKPKWFVGQRVRITQAPCASHCVGREATIAFLGTRDGHCDAVGKPYDCGILIDGYIPPPPFRPECLTHFFSIAPLDDPKADAFIAKLKRLGPRKLAAVEPRELPMTLAIKYGKGVTHASLLRDYHAWRMAVAHTVTR